MGFREHDKRTFIVDACNDFTARRITKRDFLRKMGMAGLGFGAFSGSMLGMGRPFRGLTGLGTTAAMAQTPPDGEKWLKEVGGKYAGTKIRYSTEATPPSIVANQLAQEEFTKLTGIEVEVEIVPLEQVLAKATQDVQGQLGTYDLYYLDQAWAALQALSDGVEGEIAIVTHGLVLRSLLERILDASAHVVTPDLIVGNTSVTTVERVPPWRVVELACVAHLDGGANDVAPV